MSPTNGCPSLAKGQGLHFGGLTALVVLTSLGWTALGQPSAIAFWTTIAVPIAHQVFVWLAWRLELSSAAVSRRNGFGIYIAIFFTLFGSRIISALILAWLDRGSLPTPLWPRVVLTLVASVFFLYTMVSVKRYFGMVRAAGVDHFDPAYRNLPLVDKGIFRFTDNAMYTFGFGIFWALALGFNSSAALLAAGFSHAYIWIHYFSTEKPDMSYLYK